jgi:Sec-independent protein translocase protein TatA
MGEITVILVLALIFLGPSRLPELAAGLGKLIREIRKVTSDVKNEITLDDSFRKPFEELRDAVTLPPEELKRRDQVRKAIEEARKRVEAEAEAAKAAAVAAAAAPAIEAPSASTASALDTTIAAEHPTGLDAKVPGEAPVSDPVVPPIAPPAGTVARPASASVEPVILTSAPPLEPAAPVAPVAPIVSRVPRPHLPPPSVAPPHGPRVTPPVSSLSGDRANATQVLSEADLLPSTTPAAQPAPTKPPPLPGSTPKKT